MSKTKQKNPCSFRRVLLNLQHSASVASVGVLYRLSAVFGAAVYNNPIYRRRPSAPEIMECGSTTPGKLRHWIKSLTRPYTKLAQPSWLVLFSLWDNFATVLHFFQSWSHYIHLLWRYSNYFNLYSQLFLILNTLLIHLLWHSTQVLKFP